MIKDREDYKREFNRCVERMSLAAKLQDQRRSQGYYGAALFYQFEAARWYKKAEQARINWGFAKLGEDWANDLAQEIMASYVAPRFHEPFPPYVPTLFEPGKFNSDLYQYELPKASDTFAWGTMKIAPEMVINATNHAAPLMKCNVTTIKRTQQQTDVICVCGTRMEACNYPNCNAKYYGGSDTR